jgi:glycosyltransferase involved in cell wall biosynthesis
MTPERHVLRLASVFEPRPGEVSDARFDPIGGMQNHTGALTRCLDEQGFAQTVVTARLAGRSGRERSGGRAQVVRVGLRLRRLRQLWAVLAVRHVLVPGRPVDVVHAHQGEDVATLLLALLAARVHRAPLVVTVHCSVRHTLTGPDLRSRFLRLAGGTVERAAVRRAAHVVCLAERTASLLRSDGVPEERLHVIPSGVEPSVFPPAARDGGDAAHDGGDAGTAAGGPAADPFPQAGRPRVGYVGRLAAAKRPELVVAAFDRLRCPAWLVVVGDGPQRPSVERAVARSPRRERILLHGFVDHSRVPAVLAHLDVLVLPSAYEELGSVLVEAMAAGVPVVVTRVGGMPEVVRDGETGLLVDGGAGADPEVLANGLAAAVDRLLDDPDLRRRMAVAARDRARDYSWPVLAGRVRDLYVHALVAGATGPRPARQAGAATPRAGGRPTGEAPVEGRQAREPSPEGRPVEGPGQAA